MKAFNSTKVGSFLRAASLLFLPFFLSVCGGGSNGDDESSLPDRAHQSIARIWNEEILAAIRIDTPRPPVHARNLWHLSAAMYDAWAVYDPAATGYVLNEKLLLPEEAVVAARREAISYAAYRLLKNRYALSVNAPKTLASLDALMAELGFDPAVVTVDGEAAAAVGNRAAAGIIALGNADGSNQVGNYADPTYQPKNQPLVVAFPGNQMSSPNTWQPLALAVSFTQNGLPNTSNVQSFIGARWNTVTSFALPQTANSQAHIDFGPPPQLGTASDAAFKSDMLTVLQRSAVLSPALEATIDISPAAYGNNSLGTNDGSGYAENPHTGAPYDSQFVKLGDFSRVLAEFWADGPNSETPPGHWNVLANYISDHDEQTFLFEGKGKPLDRLEWDIKLYFALNAAVHDAAVNCWGIKRIYDSVRPISAIRYMATQGQSSDPHAASYSPRGLPLVSGLTELISDETWPVGRHAGIRCCVSLSGSPAPCVDSAGNAGIDVSCVGEVAVLSWPGSPLKRLDEFAGVKWIRAKEWQPYQANTFVTPAFPGYNSGHSTFSRAAAEVLTAFTADPFFPGGMGESVAHKNAFLKFEAGPSEDVHLQWATYYDAADQAGQSRIYGGIHTPSDDFSARRAGAQIGIDAFQKAKRYFDGTLVR